MVHVYGKEPYHNIIINDLDMDGLSLMEYRGNTPLYLIRNSTDEYKLYSEATTAGDRLCIYGDN